MSKKDMKATLKTMNEEIATLQAQYNRVHGSSRDLDQRHAKAIGIQLVQLIDASFKLEKKLAA